MITYIGLALLALILVVALLVLRIVGEVRQRLIDAACPELAGDHQGEPASVADLSGEERRQFFHDAQAAVIAKQRQRRGNRPEPEAEFPNPVPAPDIDGARQAFGELVE